MKLSPLKFSVALGLALSSSFILCNLLLALLGKEMTLQILNSLFHEIDFTPLVVDDGFRFSSLLHGTLMLFVVGALVGSITVFIYNLLTKVNITTTEDSSESQPEKVIIIQTNVEDNEKKETEAKQHIGYKR